MAYDKVLWVPDDGTGDTGTRFTADRMNHIEQGIADAHAGVTSFVTALPANPVDGQECYYVADADKGVVWHLRYAATLPDGSPNPSVYRWEYLGGPPLYVEQPGAEAVTNTGIFREGVTAIAELAVPTSGVYDVWAEARSEASPVATVQMRIRLSGGGTSGGTLTSFAYVRTANEPEVLNAQGRLVQIVQGGATYRLSFSTSAAPTTFDAKKMYARPVCVGS